MGEILKETPRDFSSPPPPPCSCNNVLISFPKRWVANPKLQDSRWNTHNKSSGITSRLVSETHNYSTVKLTECEMVEKLTKKISCVVHDGSSKVVYPKGATAITMLRLEELFVVLVLHLYLLHVGLREAADATLNVKHAQQASALFK